MLTVLLASCCLSGREGERFAGAAIIVPLPDDVQIAQAPLEPSQVGEVDTFVEDEEPVAATPPPQPAEVAPGLPTDWADAFRKLDASLYFDFDLASLKATGVRILRSWVKLLKRYPQADVVVQGHTDARGTRGYNLWLGERRAKAVQDFLVIRGIKEKRVRIISYGEESLAVSGNNDRAHALNRRAVLSVEAGTR